MPLPVIVALVFSLSRSLHFRSPLPPILQSKVFVLPCNAIVPDPLISASQTEDLERLLRGAGAQVELYWQPGGHALNRAEVQAAATWLGAQAQEAS